ncbi:hypothetical protein BC828DRAFT_380117 [Blastocladiella britannica]|nr:hypothetical protein BC828DRAFT_380117 [Blastocladiella britannica]
MDKMDKNSNGWPNEALLASIHHLAASSDSGPENNGGGLLSAPQYRHAFDATALYCLGLLVADVTRAAIHGPPPPPLRTSGPAIAPAPRPLVDELTKITTVEEDLRELRASFVAGTGGSVDSAANNSAFVRKRQWQPDLVPLDFSDEEGELERGNGAAAEGHERADREDLDPMDGPPRKQQRRTQPREVVTDLPFATLFANPMWCASCRRLTRSVHNPTYSVPLTVAARDRPVRVHLCRVCRRNLGKSKKYCPHCYLVHVPTTLRAKRLRRPDQVKPETDCGRCQKALCEVVATADADDGASSSTAAHSAEDGNVDDDAATVARDPGLVPPDWGK